MIEESTLIKVLQDMFKSYNIETPDGVITVFNSLTYGEMVISFLLLLILLVFVFKWLWEVLR